MLCVCLQMRSKLGHGGRQDKLLYTNKLLNMVWTYMLSKRHSFGRCSFPIFGLNIETIHLLNQTFRCHIEKLSFCIALSDSFALNHLIWHVYEQSDQHYLSSSLSINWNYQCYMLQIIVSFSLKEAEVICGFQFS